MTGTTFDTPLFILGMPRSGTSMITGLLGEMGLWLGPTVSGGYDNPKGFFENTVLREKVIKNILTALNCDPLGVQKLPNLSALPRVPALKDTVFDILRRQGYEGQQPWGFKDAKLTLIWPLWHEGFPEARWLIVSRPRELVIKSCLKTHFMRQHSADPAFWDRFFDAYEARLQALRESGCTVWDIDASDVFHGNWSQLKTLVESLGLTWNERIMSEFIDPAYWGDRNKGTAGMGLF